VQETHNYRSQVHILTTSRILIVISHGWSPFWFCKKSVALKVPIVSATDFKKKTEALSLGLGRGMPRQPFAFKTD